MALCLLLDSLKQERCVCQHDSKLVLKWWYHINGHQHCLESCNIWDFLLCSTLWAGYQGIILNQYRLRQYCTVSNTFCFSVNHQIWLWIVHVEVPPSLLCFYPIFLEAPLWFCFVLSILATNLKWSQLPESKSCFSTFCENCLQGCISGLEYFYILFKN